MSSGSRREDGDWPAAVADGTATADRTGPSVAECPCTPAGDGDAVGAGRTGRDEGDGDTSRDEGDGPLGEAGDEDGQVQWHRAAAGDQVVLAAGAGGVRVAVAFPTDAAPEDVRAALDERDRELRHFFQTGRGDR